MAQQQDVRGNDVESDPLLPHSGDSHGAIQTASENGKQDEDKRMILYGYGIMLTSACFQSLMAFCIHVSESQHGFPTTSALVIRGAISLSLCAILIASEKLSFFHLSRTSFLCVLLQGFLGAMGLFCQFMGQARLPVGIAMTIEYSSPTLTSVFAAIFLRDPFTVTKFVTLVINFVGVALIARQSQDEAEGGSTSDSSFYGVVYATTCAVLVSVVYVLSRKMAIMDVHFVLRVTSSASFMFLVGTVGTAHSILQNTNDTKNATLSSVVEASLENHQGFLFAVLSAFAGHVSQSCLQLALKYLSTGPGIITRTLTIPFSFILGFVFLKESPSMLNFVGILFVFFSVVLIGTQKAQQDMKS